MTVSTHSSLVETPARRFACEFLESRFAVAGLLVFATMATLALLAPVISPQDPYDLAEISVADAVLPPGSLGSSGMLHVLGTDAQGRDMLSAIFYGLRISIAVGISSVFISMTIGLIVGLCGGYFGGRVDGLIMRIVDIQLSFPALLIGLIVVSALGSGKLNLIIALVVVQWAYFARTARASAIVEREKEYLVAARCLGLGLWRTIFRHLLPNCIPPTLVVVTIATAGSISLEATLSFLGIGLPVTEPSLGMLIAGGFEWMISGAYWISVFPGIALLITVAAINLAGDRVRDLLNPRLER